MTLCNKCRREISWGKEVKVSQGRLATLDNSGWQEEKWYCLPCYKKERTKKVSNQRKLYFFGELIITLILMGLIIFLLLRGGKK